MCIGLFQWYNNNVIEQFHQLIYRIKNFRSRWGLSTLKLIEAVEKEKKFDKLTYDSLKTPLAKAFALYSLY